MFMGRGMRVILIRLPFPLSCCPEYFLKVVNILLVEVYTPKDVPCHKCTVTKSRLEKAGVPFSEIVVGDELAEVLRGEGFSSFPVVKVDMGDGATWSWSDFRFDNIQRLKELFLKAA